MKAAKGTGHGAEQPLLARGNAVGKSVVLRLLYLSGPLKSDSLTLETRLTCARQSEVAVNVVGGGTLHKNDVESTTSRIAVAAAMK